MDCLLTSPPLSPSPWEGEGDIIYKRGTSSLLNTLLVDREEKEEILERGFRPSLTFFPLPLDKGKGVRGIGLLNNLNILLKGLDKWGYMCCKMVKSG
jgi:hypothetical protein